MKYPPDCKVSGENRKLYQAWKDMLKRVRPDYENAHRYYFRGIRIVYEWTDWPTFCRWAKSMGWKPGLEIDRRNNDAGYSPDNCRFVDDMEQNRNRDQANLKGALKAGIVKFHAKPFECIQTGQIFQTEIEASRVLSLDRRAIGRCLTGEFGQTKGFTFRYVSQSTIGGAALIAQRN